jgi:two-component system phosphate regulon sensor histidine kinase PhoR
VIRDIRWRIAIPYIILILVVLVGLAAVLSQIARNAQLDDLQNNLLVQAKVLSENIKDEVGTADVDELDQLSRTWAELLQARVTLIGADGLVLGESDEDRTQMDNHIRRPEIQEALLSGKGSSIRYSITVGTEMMYAAVPVLDGDEIVGFARVALPIDAVEANVSQLRQVILTVAFITAIVAAVVAVVVAHRTIRSVRRLTRVASRMADGDLDARVYPEGRDEIGDLTRTFNYMADQLRDQMLDLANEQERIKAVLDNMADGVVITDSLGHITLINPAAEHLLGTDEEEAIGRTFTETVRHHELIETWQRGCSHQEEQMSVVELIHQESFIQMIVTPLEIAGREACLVILQDLTKIRRLETVRRDFISNISHELRTPLASLKALIETLQSGASDDPPAAERFLDLADQEVDALTQMVQELLELSRIESGRVPLRLAPLMVSEVIEPPLARLKPQAKRKSQKLKVKLPNDLPYVLVDAARIQQVVGNLVHNAIKYTPENGLITIQARRDIAKDDGKLYVLISVQDTGEGIPTSEIGRIFERFYKAERARSSGGTGLGLAIAKHLVEIHGGRIWVKSKEGKGSTFFFTVPAADMANEQQDH